MEVYTIRDEKAKVFNYPFIARDESQATRMFIMTLSDYAVQISLFPDDFSLYRVCTIDEKEMTVSDKHFLDNEKNYTKGPKFIISGQELEEPIQKVRKVKQEEQKHKIELEAAIKEEALKRRQKLTKKKGWFK